MDPKWFNVNEDAQIWSGHANSAHKQFKLVAPAAILAIDEYQGSLQFETVRSVGSGGELQEFDPVTESGYPQLWIRIEDVSLLPYEDEPEDEVWPPPQDINVADAQLGHAFRVIGQWLKDEVLS